jgi:hypothetical protein
VKLRDGNPKSNLFLRRGASQFLQGTEAERRG